MKNRLEVLATLAEQVMGWTIVAGAAVSAHLKYPVCWLRDGTVLAAYEEGQAFKPWTPFTDRAQALKLAEAWYAKDKLHRSITITTHWCRPDRWLCVLRWDHGESGATGEGTFSKAAFDAVCAAEGIEVEG